MKAEPTKEQKELFSKLTPILGVSSKAVRYFDEDETNSIFIIDCADPTDKEVTFYSTMGLINYPIKGNRYEILMAGFSRYKEVANILSSCAFFVMKNGWECTYANVFETLVEMYYEDKDMKHILFVSPYIWEDKLEGFKVGKEPIEFVLAVPISQKELEYKMKFGMDALEDLFEEKGVDICDIDRKSVV